MRFCPAREELMLRERVRAILQDSVSPEEVVHFSITRQFQELQPLVPLF